ncbi:MAG: NAD(P)H-hydrate dehydratase [Opitutales bacterium]
MSSLSYADPILSCEEAARFEHQFFKGEPHEWLVMQAAGRQIARHIIQDCKELGTPLSDLNGLVLVGKGHNGGDALLACAELVKWAPDIHWLICLSHAPEQLRPNTLKAFKRLQALLPEAEFYILSQAGEFQTRFSTLASNSGKWFCIDGFLGFNFRPPLSGLLADTIKAVNANPNIVLRAAVDLPTGLSSSSVMDGCVFKADFVYATGIAKKPLFEGNASSGRVRYLDLGFFDGLQQKPASESAVLNAQAFEGLRRLRSAQCDKRSFGHVLIVAGSYQMPGALILCVQAAIRSGVGRVTVCAPQSLLPHVALSAPEAMWLAGPETPGGQLSASSLDLIKDQMGRYTACLCGPGMGHGSDTLGLVKGLIQQSAIPLLLDADALQPEILPAIKLRSHSVDPAAVILTPHLGEYRRLRQYDAADTEAASLKQFCKRTGCITVLKAAQTCYSDGKQVIYSPYGGPVLARGGSGDLLAGLIAGQLAQPGQDSMAALAAGLALHGRAADALAAARGAHCVAISDLLDFLRP